MELDKEDERAGKYIWREGKKPRGYKKERWLARFIEPGRVLGARGEI